MSADAEATVKVAILNGLMAVLTPLDVERLDEVRLRDEIFASLLRPEARWALAALAVDMRVEFVLTERGNEEPRGYCEPCRRLVGVTDRRGFGLADREAYEESRRKGLGAYLVPHDQQGSSARCPGGGKRIHA